MAERFDIENYMKDLSPEQQEKAKACKTKEELIQLAAEEDIEMPMDALENVAGGGCTDKCVDGKEHDWKVISFTRYNRVKECTVCHKQKCFPNV